MNANANANQSNSVNVQTSTQPVLVVPLNVAQQAPPAQMIQSGIPGAPATFAVDTSDSAMNAVGLSNAKPATRSRSGSNASNSSANSRVSVNKLGASASDNVSNSASNVKVSVNKLG